MNYIVAFSGKARAGKDTAAELLDKCLSRNEFYVVRYSFAEKLKEIASDLFFWDDDKSVHPEVVMDKGRNLLINIGNKMREIRPVVWVEYVLEKIRHFIVEDMYESSKVFIISDLRYKNEADLLRSFPQDYKLEDQVRIILVRVNRKKSLYLTHISETELDDYRFDYVIDNDGTFLDLSKQLKKILRTEIY